MDPETERPQVRDIRVRRLVPEHPVPVLKAARCAEITVEKLVEEGIVKNPKDGVKILGNGELTKKLNVKANAFSAAAKEKIEALGGTAEEV